MCVNPKRRRESCAIIGGMSWERWLAEVAEILNMGPGDVLYYYVDTKSLLYDAGASPSEAADFIRQNA